MDEKVVTAIHELANALAGLGSWQQQLVSMAILLVVAAGGSFFGAYLKTRATNAAMSDDLDAIKRQLAATTHTTKSIEAQISKRGELHTLRIKKLEELMEAFLETCEHYRSEYDSLFGPAASLTVSPAPHQRVIALAKFYFPEHDDSLRAVIITWREAVSAAATECLHRRPALAPSPQQRLLERWANSKSLPLKVKAENESDAFQLRLVQSMRELFSQGGAHR